MIARIDKQNSQRGVALLELTLFFGVLLAFGAGTMTLGHNLAEITSLSIASRHGARTAAAYAADIGSTACTAAASSTTSCPYDPGDTPSVTQTAVQLACDYLTKSNAIVDGWGFTASVVTDVEDEVQIYYIQVSASRAGDAKCKYCWENLLATLALNTRSIYAMEVPC